MTCSNGCTVGTCDVEGGNLGRSQFTHSLYRHFQHLHVGLALQHLVDTDVLGGDACNDYVALLVAFGLYGDVGLGIAALADIFDGDRTVDDDGVELSRRTVEH